MTIYHFFKLMHESDLWATLGGVDVVRLLKSPFCTCLLVPKVLSQGCNLVRWLVVLVVWVLWMLVILLPNMIF